MQYSAALDASGGTTPYTWSATGTARRHHAVRESTERHAHERGHVQRAAHRHRQSRGDGAEDPVSRGKRGAVHHHRVASRRNRRCGIFGAARRFRRHCALYLERHGTPRWHHGLRGAAYGTPTVAGTSNVQFTVTDNLGATAQKTLSLAVSTGLSITTASLPGGTVGAQYSAPLDASGGTTPYTWSATGLPGGLHGLRDASFAALPRPQARRTCNSPSLTNSERRRRRPCLSL